MNQSQIFEKLEKLAYNINNKFKDSGIVLPYIDGDIVIGNYKISKSHEGFYCIKNMNNDVIFDRLNLPQTAILIANDLSLGKWLNQRLFNDDKNYGYCIFEKDLFQKNTRQALAKKLWERAEFTEFKYRQALKKSQELKKQIDQEFEKFKTKINKVN